jgi:hypothetical protein
MRTLLLVLKRYVAPFAMAVCMAAAAAVDDKVSEKGLLS